MEKNTDGTILLWRNRMKKGELIIKGEVCDVCGNYGLEVITEILEDESKRLIFKCMHCFSTYKIIENERN